MKIHIECLQEKLDNIAKKEDTVGAEIKQLRRIITTLEEDLANKMEDLKKKDQKSEEMRREYE